MMYICNIYEVLFFVLYTTGQMKLYHGNLRLTCVAYLPRLVNRPPETLVKPGDRQGSKDAYHPLHT